MYSLKEETWKCKDILWRYTLVHENMKTQTKNLSYRRRSTEVGLAELVEALKLLEPEDKVKTMIANTLGFEWKEEKKKSPPDHIQPPVVTPITETPEHTKPEPSKDSHLTMLESIETRDPKNLEILFDNPIMASIEELEPTSVALHMTSPGYQPLLKDEWFRGLMSVMLATPVASRDIDWPMLEKRLANGRLLERLPLRQRPTLKRGVQLFLDRSNSMQPFWRDEIELLDRLQHLLGSCNVQVWWLEVDPWLSIEPQLNWHSPPPDQLSAETPLLIVSDFGIGEDPLGEGLMDFGPWRTLLDQAQSSCCPVIALIPAPESVWPDKLRQLIPYAYVWDRYTSLQSVKGSHHRIRN